MWILKSFHIDTDAQDKIIFDFGEFRVRDTLGGQLESFPSVEKPADGKDSNLVQEKYNVDVESEDLQVKTDAVMQMTLDWFSKQSLSPYALEGLDLLK